MRAAVPRQSWRRRVYVQPCVSEPYDTICWVIILVMCIQVLAVAVFLFEWLSPLGFSLQKAPVSRGTRALSTLNSRKLALRSNFYTNLSHQSYCRL